MTMTDPISDMLTRIRNADGAQLNKIQMPLSKLKLRIAEILKDEGYIRNYKVVERKGGKKDIKLYLKFDEEMQGAFRGIHRVSRPGLRRYVGYKDLPKFKSGFGLSILSTSRGVMTDYQAREKKVGGEVLCSIW